MDYFAQKTSFLTGLKRVDNRSNTFVLSRKENAISKF